MPAPAAPSWVERLRQRMQPAATYSVLFIMGLSGGLAVATATSLTVHYLASRPDRQVAAARVALPRLEAQPLDIEIQKAKAELDAALADHGS